MHEIWDWAYTAQQLAVAATDKNRPQRLVQTQPELPAHKATIR